MQLSKQQAFVAPGMIQQWFNDFKEFMEEKHVDTADIWEDPARWFNADETGFPLCPKSGKVICGKNASNVYNFTTSDKSNITVMACISADRGYCAPMIIFAGVRFAYQPLKDFPDTAFGRSDNGWMDSELSISWWLQNVFVPHLNAKKVPLPVVLFVDGVRGIDFLHREGNYFVLFA